jgi:tRNA modification GTPase
MINSFVKNVKQIKRYFKINLKFVKISAISSLKKEVEFEIYATGMQEEKLSEENSSYSVSYFNGFIEAENLDKLKSMLYEVGAGGINTDGEYITQKRHFYALKDARESLQTAIQRIGVTPLDLVACDIKDCWSKLGEITGSTASEDIINEIFSRFCVGK